MMTNMCLAFTYFTPTDERFLRDPVQTQLSVVTQPLSSQPISELTMRSLLVLAALFSSAVLAENISREVRDSPGPSVEDKVDDVVRT